MKKKDSVFNLWEYMYYRVTTLYSKIEKSAGFESNMDTGACAVSTCVSLNFMTILFFILAVVLRENFIVLVDNILFQLFIGGLIILILLLALYILEKKRHKIIFRQYSKETEKQKKIRGWVVITYIVLTFIFLGMSISIGREYVLGT
jgi:archaellum biogenesis protein FlaJ (TadC family)